MRADNAAAPPNLFRATCETYHIAVNPTLSAEALALAEHAVQAINALGLANTNPVIYLYLQYINILALGDHERLESIIDILDTLIHTKINPEANPTYLVNAFTHTEQIRQLYKLFDECQFTPQSRPWLFKGIMASTATSLPLHSVLTTMHQEGISLPRDLHLYQMVIDKTEVQIAPGLNKHIAILDNLKKFKQAGLSFDKDRILFEKLFNDPLGDHTLTLATPIPASTSQANEPEPALQNIFIQTCQQYGIVISPSISDESLAIAESALLALNTLGLANDDPTIYHYILNLAALALSNTERLTMIADIINIDSQTNIPPVGEPSHLLNAFIYPYQIKQAYDTLNKWGLTPQANPNPYRSVTADINYVANKKQSAIETLLQTFTQCGLNPEDNKPLYDYLFNDPNAFDTLHYATSQLASIDITASNQPELIRSTLIKQDQASNLSFIISLLHLSGSSNASDHPIWLSRLFSEPELTGKLCKTFTTLYNLGARNTDHHSLFSSAADAIATLTIDSEIESSLTAIYQQTPNIISINDHLRSSNFPADEYQAIQRKLIDNNSANTAIVSAFNALYSHGISAKDNYPFYKMAIDNAITQTYYPIDNPLDTMTRLLKNLGLCGLNFSEHGGLYSKIILDPSFALEIMYVTDTFEYYGIRPSSHQDFFQTFYLNATIGVYQASTAITTLLDIQHPLDSPILKKVLTDFDFATGLNTAFNYLFKYDISSANYPDIIRLAIHENGESADIPKALKHIKPPFADASNGQVYQHVKDAIAHPRETIAAAVSSPIQLTQGLPYAPLEKSAGTRLLEEVLHDIATSDTEHLSMDFDDDGDLRLTLGHPPDAPRIIYLNLLLQSANLGQLNLDETTIQQIGAHIETLLTHNYKTTLYQQVSNYIKTHPELHAAFLTEALTSEIIQDIVEEIKQDHTPLPFLNETINKQQADMIKSGTELTPRIIKSTEIAIEKMIRQGEILPSLIVNKIAEHLVELIKKSEDLPPGIADSGIVHTVTTYNEHHASNFFLDQLAAEQKVACSRYISNKYANINRLLRGDALSPDRDFAWVSPLNSSTSLLINTLTGIMVSDATNKLTIMPFASQGCGILLKHLSQHTYFTHETGQPDTVIELDMSNPELAQEVYRVAISKALQDGDITAEEHRQLQHDEAPLLQTLYPPTDLFVRGEVISDELARRRRAKPLKGPHISSTSLHDVPIFHGAGSTKVIMRRERLPHVNPREHEVFRPAGERTTYSPHPQGLMAHIVRSPMLEDEPSYLSLLALKSAYRDHLRHPYHPNRYVAAAKAEDARAIADELAKSAVDKPTIATEAKSASIMADQLAKIAADEVTRAAKEVETVAPLPLNGKVIHRSNHGLAHTHRVMLVIDAVADYFAQHAKDDDTEFKQFCHGLRNSKLIELIKVAAAYSITGRESEIGFSDNPTLYGKYKAASTRNLQAFLDANDSSLFDASVTESEKAMLKGHLLEITRNLCNPYFETLEPQFYGGEPPSAADIQQRNFMHRILSMAHDLDLLRCFTPGAYSKDMEIYKQLSQQGPEQRLALTQVIRYNMALIEAHGDCLLTRVELDGSLATASNPYQPPFDEASQSMTRVLAISETAAKPCQAAKAFDPTSLLPTCHIGSPITAGGGGDQQPGRIRHKILSGGYSGAKVYKVTDTTDGSAVILKQGPKEQCINAVLVSRFLKQALDGETITVGGKQLTYYTPEVTLASLDGHMVQKQEYLDDLEEEIVEGKEIQGISSLDSLQQAAKIGTVYQFLMMGDNMAHNHQYSPSKSTFNIYDFDGSLILGAPAFTSNEGIFTDQVTQVGAAFNDHFMDILAHKLHYDPYEYLDFEKAAIPLLDKETWRDFFTGVKQGLVLIKEKFQDTFDDDDAAQKFPISFVSHWGTDISLQHPDYLTEVRQLYMQRMANVDAHLSYLDEVLSGQLTIPGIDDIDTAIIDTVEDDDIEESISQIKYTIGEQMTIRITQQHKEAHSSSVPTDITGGADAAADESHTAATDKSVALDLDNETPLAEATGNDSAAASDDAANPKKKSANLLSTTGVFKRKLLAPSHDKTKKSAPHNPRTDRRR